MNAAIISNVETPPRDRVTRRAALGAIALGCYALHAVVQTAAGTPENLLWACHAAALTVGVGLLLRIPLLTAVGTLLLTVGVPAWLINLAAGGAFYPTSILTHVGGWTCGVLGLRASGRYPRHAACGALVVYAALMLTARLWTPAAANVNLAHAPWLGLGNVLAAWHGHLAIVLAIWAALIFMADRVLQGIVGWTACNSRLHGHRA